MSRYQTCTAPGCFEVRDRHSHHRMCRNHDREAEAREQEAYEASEEKAFLDALEEVSDLEEMKDFIRLQVMPRLGLN